MLTQHTARLIARFVLAWFALYLGAAVASPLVHPSASFELVCSGAGTAKLIKKSDTGSEAHSASMDCPLCAPGSAPPPLFPTLIAAPAQPLAYVLRSIPAARIAGITAAPLPARGPPLVS
ncbi:hypothetical protein GT347_08885 [Xylophilus rhododendri]|uniref:DUF2946 domain-containing protein n=1 Tax=Xylophilus rhododendri TaxID=2697032 RepID=A0A857J4R9_9BURK|nr:hypothetical protein [Xylophilus rhododendri]QHI98099.1 hypothetical protein GT347_08885 [Xylophilus rhododendri]